MLQKFSKALDHLSEYLAARKGLLSIIGMLLIIANYLLQFFIEGWIAQTNLLLHLGALIATLGFMLAWAL